VEDAATGARADFRADGWDCHAPIMSDPARDARVNRKLVSPPGLFRYRPPLDCGPVAGTEMNISRRGLVGASISAAALPAATRGQGRPIRVGVLADENGPYADFSGVGSVIAARLAAAEFPDGVLGRPIEILSGDHQNKPDIASSMARGWLDQSDAEAIVECSTSGAALALQQVMREKQRIFLVTVAGSSDITGKAC
jgi:ABC-type branched-subunit amino acid transport system substrate-binding protein